MKIIGYRVGDKFRELLPKARDYDINEDAKLRLLLESFEGLFICHASQSFVNAVLGANSISGRLHGGEFCALLVSSDKLARPPGCETSEFVHCLSRSVDSPCRNPIVLNRFTMLLKYCQPRAYERSLGLARAMWRIVDPREAWAVNQVQNPWQSRRNELTHNRFEHEFRLPLSRVAVTLALNALPRRLNDKETAKEVSRSLAAWGPLYREISELLAAGNPAAISAPDLQAALANGATPEASTVIERYEREYGAIVDDYLRRARESLDGVDEVARDVGGALKGNTASKTRVKGKHIGSVLSMLCQGLANDLHGLEELARLAGDEKTVA